MNKQSTIKFPKQDHLLSVKVSSTNESEVLSIVENSLRENVQIFISTPNPEIVLKAQSDEKLLKAVNTANIALPDGIGILWASKRLGLSLKLNRITGREMMEHLFELAIRKKYKLFLLGASEESNALAIHKIKTKSPKLKVEGMSDISVNEEGESEQDSQIIKKINDFSPHILFVALGAPKQEKWVASNISKLNAGVVMVVGGAIDYYAGTVAHVPSFLSQNGFEWLWRLLTQPSRLPRIFNALVRFPLLVLLHRGN